MLKNWLDPDNTGTTILDGIYVGIEENNYAGIKSLLKKEDIEIISASNSREALTMINSENEKNYDLILVNTQMPGTGANALFRIGPETKMNIQNSTNDFLSTPFTEKQFVNFIKRKI